MTKFKRIETEIAKLHSYETFNLQAVAEEYISDDTKEWMEKEIK